MSDQSSVSESALIGPQRVRTVVQGILRSAQASGWTDDALSGATGIPARTIKSYRVEGKEPSLANALSLGCVLGTVGLNPILALIGYIAKPLDEADELNVSRIVADGLQHFSIIANAAADGRIDHIEAPACREAADHIIATVLPLSSAGDAA